MFSSKKAKKEMELLRVRVIYSDVNLILRTFCERI